MPEDASAETIAIVKKAYGLDKPIPLQYLIWLGRAVTGDLGMSIATGRAVSGEIRKALSNTLILALGAIGLSFSLAFCLGIVAGYLSGTWADRVVTGVAVVGVSVPNYWLGIALVIVFAVELQLLPATGMGPGGSGTFNLFNLQHVQHLLLPVVTLSMIPMGIIARTTRSAVAETLNQDFVHTLRAKGLKELVSVSIIIASGLSFLGLGVEPPKPDWGLMLNTLRQAIYINPLIAALPGSLIFMTSMCFNLLSDGLRAAMDVRM